MALIDGIHDAMQNDQFDNALEAMDNEAIDFEVGLEESTDVHLSDEDARAILCGSDDDDLDDEDDPMDGADTGYGSTLIRAIESAVEDGFTDEEPIEVELPKDVALETEDDDPEDDSATLDDLLSSMT